MVHGWAVLLSEGVSVLFNLASAVYMAMQPPFGLSLTEPGNIPLHDFAVGEEAEHNVQ